jgi:hypothetical protein
MLQNQKKYQVVKVDTPSAKDREACKSADLVIWIDTDDIGISDIIATYPLKGEVMKVLHKEFDGANCKYFVWSNVPINRDDINIGDLIIVVGSVKGEIHDPEVAQGTLGFFSAFPGGIGVAEPRRHAKVYVRTYEEGITFDEYEVVLKESTLQEPFVSEMNPPVPFYAPGYLLEYGGKRWIMPSRYIRFVDYDQLGEQDISEAIGSQCDMIKLIHRNKFR